MLASYVNGPKEPSSTRIGFQRGSVNEAYAMMVSFQCEPLGDSGKKMKKKLETVSLTIKAPWAPLQEGLMILSWPEGGLQKLECPNTKHT